MLRGAASPIYHQKKHDIVENRIQAPKYRAPGKHDKAGPAFLRQEAATKLISPNTYNTIEAFKMT